MIKDVGSEAAPGHSIDGDLGGERSMVIQSFLNTAHRHLLGAAAAGRKFERLWKTVDVGCIRLIAVREGGPHPPSVRYPELAISKEAQEFRAFDHADSAI
ncbi:hypothetical protein P3W85_44115 [Cupriavidus basilensis]|uniref:Uncharacterized protein n=1 Tax=Cupriavidus basilensis TaxID=68895 RepID=A0ABT6B4R7_9BURK|nr:hypothetical protein [Cupriavidus basilensis]MDF3839873.1 hypothetical protein [Cupriavidus basilensis]